MITIYKLTDILSNMLYVGSTNNLKRRLNEHNTHYRSAKKMYGFGDFTVEILEIVDSKKTGTLKEKEWCEQLIKDGYNVVCKKHGKALTSKLKKEYSEIKKEEFYSGKSKDRVLAMNNKRKVKVTDQFGNIYESYSECARKIGTHPITVSNVARGKLNQINGYVLREFI